MRDNEIPEKDFVEVPVTLLVGGNRTLILGYGSLQGGTLSIKFRDSLPAKAIQRMISRGAIPGLSIDMIKPDLANLAEQDQMIKEKQSVDDESNTNLDGEN